MTEEEWNQEDILPIAWKMWDEVDHMELQFYDVMFTDAFGPIPKGARFDLIFVSYDKGIVETYKSGEEPEVIHSVKFKAVAIEAEDCSQ